jgi:hypothetical protein
MTRSFSTPRAALAGGTTRAMQALVFQICHRQFAGITERDRTMSNPNPSAIDDPRRRLRAWLGFLGLLGYAVFMAWHSAVVAGGADSSGYLNSARLFAAGRLVADLRAPAEMGPRASLDAMHFLPQGFFPGRDKTQLTPTYPTGLPLHFAAAGRLLGWKLGPLLVELCAAISAVWLCYLAARELGLAAALAASGAIMLAAFPVFLFTSVQPLSDTLATAWSLAALYTALRARARACWAVGAGAALAMAVLIRPTNLLLVPALLVLLGLDWRRLALFGVGGLPGAAWLAFYNHVLYGHPLRSGYGETVLAAFDVSYGVPTAIHFIKWLALLLPAVVLVLPFIGLVRRDLRRRELFAFALMFGAIVGCYAFYEVSHEVWWCLRFILPVVPALILAALLGVEALARGPGNRWPRAFRPIVALGLALWAIGNSWYWSPRLGVFLMKRYELAYADGALAARDRLPEGALVVCSAFSGSLYFYTDFAVLRSDQIEASVFARYAALAYGAGRPVCAVLFESEETEAFRRCPGQWTRLAQIRNVGLWQLASPHFSHSP